MDNGTRLQVQEAFLCCGFDTKVDKEIAHPSCDTVEVSYLNL